MTDDFIGVEGAKALSEMLTVNTTLTKLWRGGEEEKAIEVKKEKKQINDRQWDWRIWKEDGEGCMGWLWRKSFWCLRDTTVFLTI